MGLNDKPEIQAREAQEPAPQLLAEGELPVGSCLCCGTHGQFVVFTNGSLDPLHPRWIGACAECRDAKAALTEARSALAQMTEERDELTDQLADHCACVQDGRGELETECQEHETIRKERDELRAALARCQEETK